MGIKDLLIYIIQTLSASDVVIFVASILAVTLVGLLTPKINNIIFANVVTSTDYSLLLGVTILLVCVSISVLLITTVKTMLLERIKTKMDVSVQAASMMRVLSLPADFFKSYSAGELSNRTQSINNLCGILVNTILSTGLTSLFSFAYITQIWGFAPSLVVPSLCIVFVTILFSLISTFVQMNISRKRMEIAAKESGLSYALISGVQKIKLSGAEKRAFAKWASVFNIKAKYIYNPPMFIKINSVITTAISLIGTIVLYYFAIQSKVSVSDYYAFNVAYGMVSGAFTALSSIAITIAGIKPIFEMVKPILNAVPEISAGKKVITHLSGSVELNNVSFRYNEHMPQVLDNITLKIKSGQYVAIVGKTGCGKSTLLRLLLGFEKPQKGAVYYDEQDISKVDLKSLRRKIGVVMQNGKLFNGDIYSNITISAPWLTVDEAWESAELAGVAEDIRNMPMGMNTMISEGSGGVSGGQRQRLMIARAIAPKPRILMFDEATSALDNITQKIVSDSLDSLKCTRIVIAHRLSTIKHCDRIIVLDQGKIIEDGSYDELIANNGYFSELVARQQIDDSANK